LIVDMDYSMLDEFPDAVEGDLHYCAQMLARMRDRLVDAGHGAAAGVMCHFMVAALDSRDQMRREGAELESWYEQ
jgi:hypothetical protein